MGRHCAFWQTTDLLIELGKARALGSEMCPPSSCGYGKLGCRNGRECRALECCGDSGPQLGWAPGKPAPAACFGSSVALPVAVAAPLGLRALIRAPHALGAGLQLFQALLLGSLSSALLLEGTSVSCCCCSFSLAAAWPVAWGMLKFGISRGQVSSGGRSAPSARGAGGSALILDLFQQL